jgi:hypothetical protein
LEPFDFSGLIMKISHESIAGAWIVAGSEIDDLLPGGEIHRFTPPDRFETTYIQPDGYSCRTKYRYELTEEGFRYGIGDKLHCQVTAWLDSGFLIFRPNHGMETWMSRTD